MPVYTVRQADGSDLRIDTTHFFAVHPPSQRGAVVDVETWGRRASLDKVQAGELAKQDFDLRRKLGSCPACYFHAGRPDPGECDRLCCAVRETALLAGVETSPYVRRAPPAAVAPEDEDPQWWALRTGTSWALLSLGLHERAALVAAGAFAGAVVLFLCARWQDAEPRPAPPRESEEKPNAE